MGNAIILREQRIGVETTYLTKVPGTHKIPGIARMTKTQPQLTTQSQHGSFAQNFDSYPGIIAAGVQYDHALKLDYFHQFLAAGLEGLSAPTTPGSGTAPNKTAEQWVFNQNATTDDRKSVTWWWGDLAGRKYSMPGCRPNRIALSGAGDGNTPVQMSAAWIAPDREVETVYDPASLATRGLSNPTHGKLVLCFIHDTTIGLGANTKVIAWTWAITNAYSYDYNCDGTLKASGLTPGARTMELTMSISKESYEEEDAWLSGTPRYIRIEVRQNQLPVATYAAGQVYKLYIDAYGRWTTGDTGERGVRSSYNFSLVALQESTWGSECQLTLFTDAVNLTT